MCTEFRGGSRHVGEPCGAATGRLRERERERRQLRVGTPLLSSLSLLVGFCASREREEIL